MSKFSNYLKILIERYPYSISQLSRISGVERTSIHKALTDERILAYKSAEKLAGVFCLSPYEKKKFFKYHAILLQGEEVFESRQSIKDLFKMLSDIPVSYLVQKEKNILFTKRSGLTNEQFYSGTLAVTDIIKYLLTYEIFETKNPEIYLNFSLENNFLKNYLFLLYQQEQKEIYITHIIPFSYRENMESSAKGSVSLLKWILPLCLIAGNTYRPYFYYDHSNVSCYSDPFPYYIITTNYLLCLSEDLQTAILHTNPKRIAYYKHFAENIIHQCEPFLSYDVNSYNILQQYKDTSANGDYYMIMSQPYINGFHTENNLSSYTESVSIMPSRFPDCYTIFTYSGIKKFIDTGIICNVSSELTENITKQKRFSLLLQIREAIADGSTTGLIINPASFQTPEYLTFIVEPGNGIHIFSNLFFEKEPHYCSMYIKEPILNAAFYDFATNLLLSEDVYTKEDTLILLDELLSES